MSVLLWTEARLRIDDRSGVPGTSRGMNDFENMRRLLHYENGEIVDFDMHLSSCRAVNDSQ